MNLLKMLQKAFVKACNPVSMMFLAKFKKIFKAAILKNNLWHFYIGSFIKFGKLIKL